MEQILFDAQKLLNQLEIKPDQTIADFGAGSGFITLLCAQKVGKNGMVYALDVLEEPLEVIAAKAREQQLFHIKTIRVNLEKENGSAIGDNTCDWVIVSNVLFQSDKQQEIVAEALRVAKPGGFICIVDWYPDKILVKTGHYPVGPEQIKTMATKLGAKPKNNFELDQHHYGLVFEK